MASTASSSNKKQALATTNEQKPHFQKNNDIIKQLEANPHKYGLEINIDILEIILKQAQNDYYNTDKPLLSDTTFDILENIVKINKPNSYIFDNIGATVINSDEAVKLPFYMGSLDKVKPNEKSLSKWFEKHNKNIVISEKLDGLSALLIISLEAQQKMLSGKESKEQKNSKDSKEGNLQMQLYKHGDGYEGQDISHLLKHISISHTGITNSPPHTNPSPTTPTNINNNNNNNNNKALIAMLSSNSGTIALRGEIIIKNTLYNTKYNKMYPKARSLVAGVVNTKKPDISIVKDMEIIFYEIINPNTLTFLQQFEMLEKMGFNTAKYKLYNSLIESSLPSILIDYKKQSNYEIDGIVLADSTQVYKRYIKGNPEYSVAFKMQLEEQIASTTVVNVEYNISKHGTLAPRIEYKPIMIKGDSHQFTTGFNLKYIVDNNINIGTEIKIIKSGDVIPYIYEFIKHSSAPLMPPKELKWHWNATHVDGIVDDIENNTDVRAQKLVAFFKVMCIDGIGIGVINKFISAGYDSLKVILSLTPDVIASLGGFQIKSAINIYNAINKVLNIPQPLYRVMVASGVFGIGLGEKKLQTMLDTIPNFMEKWQKKQITLNILNEIIGFNDKTSTLVINSMDNFIKWLILHPMCKYIQSVVPSQNTVQLTTSTSTSTSTSHATSITSITNTKSITNIISNNTRLTGMVAVFTGIRNADLETRITDLGGVIGSVITGKTTIIIAKNPNDNSSKLTKARETGIEIINITDFEKKYIKT